MDDVIIVATAVELTSRRRRMLFHCQNGWPHRRKFVGGALARVGDVPHVHVCEIMAFEEPCMSSVEFLQDST